MGIGRNPPRPLTTLPSNLNNTLQSASRPQKSNPHHSEGNVFPPLCPPPTAGSVNGHCTGLAFSSSSDPTCAVVAQVPTPRAP